MESRRARVGVLVLAGLVAALGGGLYGQSGPSPAGQAIPKDLHPLLEPKPSEMRLVTTRYTLDRATLNGNFLGAPRGGGRGGGAPASAADPLSPGRIARLKRFDLDWQAALAALDASKLSPAGTSDLTALRETIAANLAALDTDAAKLAQISPVVPFASVIVQLVESRIRIEDVDAEAAAGVLTRLTGEIGAVRRRIESGLPPTPTAWSLRIGKDLALRGAAAVGVLRAALREWFSFYNGYDPLFTWWMGLPYKQADAALEGYATFLTETVAAANLPDSGNPTAGAGAVAPAPPPPFASVPDLAGLIALPHDEMTGIVQRFRGAGGGRGGGRGGQQGAPGGQPVTRDRAFYQAWLTALRSLDFRTLSRNAQVDYLYIKKIAEQQIARDGVEMPPDPPRKTDDSGIQGAARGRQGLIFDLQDELVPYTPEELIAFAEQEFGWCEREMRKASAEMGLGDDWKQAMERVKGMHPPPGGQAGVVRDLVFEAVDYLRAKDLLTVPAVAAESLHMIMMTAERQLVNPFFTGGAQISVSYPTDTMEYDTRIQSMRGNNTPFSHATAFHEMIPGHNLVFYMSARYGAYRANLGGNTPFYGEGWPLYWELLLYDLGFQDTPEKRIGALFWRMHRCARIIFSLKFHMGQWSPQECVDFLVDRVNFERENAMGEVRRSFQGGYGPLYQAAYLLGGLQLRSLRRELVDGGLMTQKAFHDEVLRQGSMPIAMLRLALGRQPLTRDMPVDWRFLDQR